MSHKKGVYSLIQYCPNVERKESANIGVVLLCEGTFIGAEVTDSLSRIARRFKDRPFTTNQLSDLARAAKEMFQSNEKRIQSKDDLYQLSQSRANHILITEPSFVKVDHPQATLMELFRDLVTIKPKSRHTHVEEVVRSILSKRGILEKVRNPITLHIPTIGEDFSAPFSFRNGQLNIIKPQRFRSPAHPFKEAAAIALKGRYMLQDRKAKLHVVAELPAQLGAASANQVRTILSDQNVEFYEIDSMAPLFEFIEREAHRS